MVRLVLLPSQDLFQIYGIWFGKVHMSQREHPFSWFCHFLLSCQIDILVLFLSYLSFTPTTIFVNPPHPSFILLFLERSSPHSTDILHCLSLFYSPPLLLYYIYLYMHMYYIFNSEGLRETVRCSFSLFLSLCTQHSTRLRGFPPTLKILILSNFFQYLTSPAFSLSLSLLEFLVIILKLSLNSICGIGLHPTFFKGRFQVILMSSSQASLWNIVYCYFLCMCVCSLQIFSFFCIFQSLYVCYKTLASLLLSN